MTLIWLMTIFVFSPVPSERHPPDEFKTYALCHERGVEDMMEEIERNVLIGFVCQPAPPAP